MNQAETQQLPNRDRSRKLLLGFSIGVALGLALGLALDSMPAGLVLGIALGISLGLAFSGPRREPSKTLTIAGIVLLVLGVALLAVILSLVQPRWWCDHPVLNLLPGC